LEITAEAVLTVAHSNSLSAHLPFKKTQALPSPEIERSPVKLSISSRGSLVLGALTLLLVWLGVYPAPFIELIQTTLASLG
jgi:NADH:ubiquinone oxidoreductase subunit 4 (subunit M)